MPKVVWLSGLFNPQSFLTAVMQTTARRNDWPLDKTVLLTEVTKKTPEQVGARGLRVGGWARHTRESKAHVPGSKPPLNTKPRHHTSHANPAVLPTPLCAQVDAPSRDGAFIHGLTLEGARWDDKVGCLEDSKPKELFYSMPVILVRAVTADKADARDVYQCPAYTTEARFREEVFTAQLKTKTAGAIKWTLAGVCMFLDVV